MKTQAIIALFDETGLSPESLAEWIGVSNSTYRRWKKSAPGHEVAQEYRHNIAAGVYRLLGAHKLSYDSRHVNLFLEQNLPDFFQAAVGRFQEGKGNDFFSPGSPHQEKVTSILHQIGSSAKARAQVNRSSRKIAACLQWGAVWKSRVQQLTQIVRSTQCSCLDKLVAYGALFYLILPFDLIPDAVPVFGYVDDFGMLGFAAAYYTNRFPELATAEI